MKAFLCVLVGLLALSFVHYSAGDQVTCPGPDGFGYYCSFLPFEWIDNTINGTIEFFDDDEIRYFPLGFDFTYYGVNYTFVGVSSNGFLTFTSNDSGCCDGELDFDLDFTTVIAGLWDDLDPSEGGAFFWSTLGYFPNRVWVGTWIATEWHDLIDGAFRLVPRSNFFQFVLEERTNAIRIHYLLASDPESDFNEFEDDIFLGTHNIDTRYAPYYEFNGLTALFSTDDFRVTFLWNGELVYGTSFTVAYFPPPEQIQCPGPDDFGYTCHIKPLNWIDTSNGFTFTFEDDEIVYFPIGFAFNFYGTFYDLVGVSDNGFLSFRGSETGEGGGEELPEIEVPQIIAGWWASLEPRNDTTFTWEVFGSEPARRWVGTWTNIHYEYDLYSNSSLTFQFVLREDTNDIIINYKHLEFPEISVPEKRGIDGSFFDISVGIQDYVVSNLQAFFFGDSILSDGSFDPFSLVFDFPPGGKGTTGTTGTTGCPTTGTTGKTTGTTAKIEKTTGTTAKIEKTTGTTGKKEVTTGKKEVTTGKSTGATTSGGGRPTTGSTGPCPLHAYQNAHNDPPCPGQAFPELQFIANLDCCCEWGFINVNGLCLLNQGTGGRPTTTGDFSTGNFSTGDPTDDAGTSMHRVSAASSFSPLLFLSFVFCLLLARV